VGKLNKKALSDKGEIIPDRAANSRFENENSQMISFGSPTAMSPTGELDSRLCGPTLSDSLPLSFDASIFHFLKNRYFLLLPILMIKKQKARYGSWLFPA
jgi:hypothetical protein